MATFVKEVRGALGVAGRELKVAAVTFMEARAVAEVHRPAKTAAGVVGMGGSMVAGKNVQTHTKTVRGVLGTTGVTYTKTVTAVTVMAGGMAHTGTVYTKTHDPLPVPLPWLEGTVAPPSVVMGGGFAKQLNSQNVIAKSVAATVGMSGGVVGPGRVYVKTVVGVVTMTGPGTRADPGPDAGAGRRSLRWINRRRPTGW